MTSSAQQIPVGDVELCVESFGDADAPPLLLLSGAAASMDWWPVALCRRLAGGDGSGGRHVLRYDHRDTGRSTTGPAGVPTYGGRALGDDALGLVAALGLGPLHLVGVSMGAAIAQSVALTRPDLVASLTLVATSPVGGVEATLPGPLPALAARFADPPPDPDWSDRDAVVAWFLDGERAFAGPLGVDEEAVRAAACAMVERSHDVAAAGNHWRAVADGDGPALDVHDLAAPTLVVHGTHDPLFPLPHGEALAAAVPGARLLVVEGMGHQVPPASTWDVVVPAVLGHTAS